MGGSCSTYGGEEKCTQGFGGGTSEKDLLGRSRRRWDDNIMMSLQEMGCGVMDWFDLVQDRGQVAGTCKRDNEPSG
jgi:hypothetical protein